jgi:ATPase subunit of ABC transporter with duplicated ATPase domains
MMIERLDTVDKPWEGWDLRFEIAAAPRSGAVAARLAGVVVARGAFTLGPIDLEIRSGERVAIVGANGSGKTTLLGALLGDVAIDTGTRHLGAGVVPGTLAQARDRFGDTPLLDAFVRATGIVQSEARSVLAKFGLGADHVLRAASSLSPGERTRAELALLMAIGVNAIVLDEPTNHLDLPAIEQLEQALDGFAGTIAIVSHDRRLLDALTLTRRIELHDGHITADAAL